MPYLLSFVAYCVTLVGLVALTAWRGTWDQRCTAVALLANWGACTVFAHSMATLLGAEQQVAVWQGPAAIDLTSAFLLAIVTHGRAPLVVCGVWGFQGVAHVAFALTGTPEWAEEPYLVTLSVLAWGQALFLGGWWGGLAERFSRRRDARRDALGPSSVPHPVAREEGHQ